MEVRRILGRSWKNIRVKLEEYWVDIGRRKFFRWKLEDKHVMRNSAHFPEARGTV
jgi:hypothetical protein